MKIVILHILQQKLLTSPAIPSILKSSIQYWLFHINENN